MLRGVAVPGRSRSGVVSRLWWDAGSFVAAATLALAGTALAQEGGSDPSQPGFLGLSFGGDGHQPTAADLFAALDRSVASSRAAANASPRGDATYGIPIALPPALLMPDLALTYSSSAGRHSPLGRGWALRAGMTITRPSRQAEQTAWGTHTAPWFVSGGGLDGRLILEADGEVTYLSESPALVAASYDEDKATWTVTADGVTTVLQPDAGVPDPRVWRSRTVTDSLGNQVVYNWSGPYLDAISYGSNVNDFGTCGGKGDPVQVTLSYEPRPAGQESLDGSQGSIQVVNERVWRIEAEACFDGRCAVDAAWELGWTDVCGEDMLGSVERVAADLTGNRILVAELGYSGNCDGLATHLFDADFSDDGPPLLMQSTSSAVGSSSSSDVNNELVDYNGDGLPESVFGFDTALPATISGTPNDPEDWSWSSERRDIGDGGLVVNGQRAR